MTWRNGANETANCACTCMVERMKIASAIAALPFGTLRSIRFSIFLGSHFLEFDGLVGDAGVVVGSGLLLLDLRLILFVLQPDQVRQHRQDLRLLLLLLHCSF